MKPHFGKQLKAARKAKGYTQEALGALLGMKGNSVARLERGKNAINWRNLEKLGELLGQPASFYFSDEKPQAASSAVVTRSTLIGDIVMALSSLEEEKLVLLRERVLGELDALRLRTLKSDATNRTVNASRKIK